MSNLPGSSTNDDTEQLRQASDAALARNFEITNCLECDHELQIDEGVILRDCFHIFCDQCLVRTIKTTIEYDVQVHCPHVDGDRRCSTLIQEREIRSLLSGEDCERYERKCLELAEGGNASSVHCLTPKCKGWIEVTGCVSSFECVVCCQKNCLSCMAIHSGKSCREHQIDVNNNVYEDEDGYDDDDDLYRTATSCMFDENLSPESVPSKEVLKNLQAILESVSHIKIKDEVNPNTPSTSTPSINLEELRALSDALLVRNTDSSKCLICDEDVQANEGVILRDCFHTFCDGCLTGTIKGALDENVEVRCPAILDGTQRCSTVIQEREIRSLLKAEDYEKYEQRCLEVAEGGSASSMHCLTPNCKGWVILEGNARNLPSFHCQVCSSENCIPCKAIHPEKSCEEYQAEIKKDSDEKLTEEAIKELLEQRKAMLCPSCKRVITKNGGCDFIRCKCRFEICWPTRGPRWGPAGEGDDSGGCHCTLEERCHPECEGCHVFIK